MAAISPMKAPKLQLTLTWALPPPGLTAKAIRTSRRLTAAAPASNWSPVTGSSRTGGEVPEACAHREPGQEQRDEQHQGGRAGDPVGRCPPGRVEAERHRRRGGPRSGQGLGRGNRAPAPGVTVSGNRAPHSGHAMAPCATSLPHCTHFICLPSSNMRSLPPLFLTRAGCVFRSRFPGTAGPECPGRSADVSEGRTEKRITGCGSLSWRRWAGAGARLGGGTMRRPGAQARARPGRPAARSQRPR